MSFNVWDSTPDLLEDIESIFQQNQHTWNQQPSVIHSTPPTTVPSVIHLTPSTTVPTNGFTTNPSLYPASNSTSYKKASTETSKPGKRQTGKPKRVRTAFSSDQLLGLEAVFKKTSYVSRADRVHLSQRFALKDQAIKVWFQNRRMKQKKEVVSPGNSDFTPLEVSSSTTSPVNHQDYVENMDYKVPVNSNYELRHAQEAFIRAKNKYEEYCRQQNICLPAKTFDISHTNLYETMQDNNVSPVHYCSQQNIISKDYFETSSQSFSASTPKVPVSDDTTILNKIEQDIEASQNDSGFVSIDSDTLDDLSVLINQSISHDSKVPLEDNSLMHIESAHLSDAVLIGSPTIIHTSPVMNGNITRPTLRDFFQIDPRDIV